MNEHQQSLLTFIQTQNGQTSEYEIFGHLAQTFPDFFLALGDNTSLYRKHFYLLNQLYQLSDGLSDKGFKLLISATKIQMVSYQEDQKALTSTESLREFYLDLDNLNLTQAEVDAMLTTFWQKYLAIDEKFDALITLELENTENLTKKIVKKKYAELAKQSHPDHGGCEHDFIKIKQAKDILLKLL